MHKWKSKAGLIARSLVALGLIAILPLACKPAPKHTGPREKMTLAYSTATNAILVHIALAKHFFFEEGLDVEPQPHAFGKLALNAVLAGKADLATVADTPIVLAIMNGKKITTLAAIQTSNKDLAIIARRDRGISKPTDLTGKRIGVPVGTSADFFAYTFLLANGIENKQVTFIDIKPADMAAALNTGEVDAVSVFHPTLKQLMQGLGENGSVFYGESLYTETFCVAGLQEYVQKNPEAAKKFLRALIKAEQFALHHEVEAQELVAALINLDKALVEDAWAIVTSRVTLDQALLLDFEDQARWVLKNKLGTSTTMPYFLDYIYVDGLATAKPEAVRIVR